MDALPCSNAHGVRDDIHHPPLASLNDNRLWSTTTKLKTKETLPRLPHPLSLNVFPLPVNKWSATSHPIRGLIMGYKRIPISYHHFYFHNDRVLQTKAFAASTTATTIGDGGKPRGSTELDAITGHNCAMTKQDYTIFATVVLRTQNGATHYGEQPSEGSFINTLLCDYVCLTNLSAFF
jgi:hypothetical protein